MTSAKKLWDLSGGIPKIVYQALTEGPTTTDTVMVAGVAGYRIIPVWLAIWGTGTTVSMQFSLRRDNALGANNEGTVLHKGELDTTYMQPNFFNFGGSAWSSVPAGDALEIRLYGDSSASNLHATVGYYLIAV